MQMTNNPIIGNPLLKEVYNKAMAMLGRRDYSTAELTEKLMQKGFSEEDCQTVLAYLTEKGYVNDRRYGERLIEKADRLYGKRRIAQLLYQHKLDTELIRELMDEFDDSHAEDDLVEKLNRISRGKPVEETDIPKLTAKLMRQGYSFEAVRNAILRYTEEIEEGTDS